jgi:hypothetical protein
MQEAIRKISVAVMLAFTFITVSMNAVLAAESPRAKAREGEFRNRTAVLNWDAFVDIEARVANKDTLPDQGFTLNDASLGFSKEIGRANAVVELPFASDLSGTSNRFTFAENRAQAYLSLKFQQPFELRAGQYHTIFGLEPNDSRGRFFADPGVIKTYLIPTTHTGVLATYKMGSASIRGQIVNPSSRGNMSQVSPEFGLQGRMEFGRGGYGSLGASMNEAKANASNQNTNKTNLLVDFVGGTTIDKLGLGGEIAIRKASGSDKTANAFGLFGVYQQTDLLGWGGRIGHIRDAFVVVSSGTSGTIESVLSFAFGPSYKLDPDLTLRGDFSLGTTKIAGGSDETLYGATISLLAQF